VDVMSVRGRALRWLVDEACPLWWTAGRDLAAGGYVERIGLDGTALVETRRVRVTARQVYAFAVAGRVGWAGPVDEAVRHGLAFLRGAGAGHGGGILAKVAPDGTVVDPGPDLYDQAFWILALAEAKGVLADESLEAEALKALDVIDRDLRHPVIGYEERKPRALPLRANPHMHLLEAAVAWVPIGRDPRWLKLGREVIDMCRRLFRDPATGALLEYFDADWKPVQGPEGDVVEPGHLFEWAWLLWRWQVITGEDHSDMGLRFAEIARSRGVDPIRGVALDEITRDFHIRRATARCWPQTERLKAAIACRAWHEPGSDPRAEAEREIVEAWGALERYLDVPRRGLWRDRMREDGSFVDEPAPASTFYHLACAVSELRSIEG
jgi:mannose/cellobiose epimerase-like protein (N-acyl-D-glucosamine 2-epimerase family)